MDREPLRQVFLNGFDQFLDTIMVVFVTLITGLLREMLISTESVIVSQNQDLAAMVSKTIFQVQL